MNIKKYGFGRYHNIWENIEIVKAAVESADNQTFNDLEVLVIDDNGEGTERQLANQKFLTGANTGE